MARIRSIKPDFWTDGDVVSLSYAARLLFIGSWNFAICDFGHVADDALRLKMQVLPADDVDATALVDELLISGRITRLCGSDGRTYLHIKRFTDHQKIERRWSPRCPACSDDTLTTAPNLPQPLPASPKPADSRPTSAREGKGREGKGLTTPSSADADAAFETFWTDYPRKVGKSAARKAWNSATKTNSAEDVTAGLKAQLPLLLASEEKFQPHATTWLNAGRWQDEPPPAARRVNGWWND